MAKPSEEVWAIVGDGGFQMTMAELATAVQEKVNVKVAIINNGYLGMVRQWQEFFYEERYNATPMVNPDFCKLAEAYGIPAMKVTKRSEMESSVAWPESTRTADSCRVRPSRSMTWSTRWCPRVRPSTR